MLRQHFVLTPLCAALFLLGACSPADQTSVAAEQPSAAEPSATPVAVAVQPSATIVPTLEPTAPPAEDEPQHAAEALVDETDLEDALDNANATLTQEPDNLDALTTRATILSMLGELEAALADYDRVLMIAPDDPELYVGRAAVLAGLDEIDRAIADYTTALEMDHSGVPGYELLVADWYYSRGDLYLTRGNVPDDIYAAQEDFQRCLALDPEYAPALYSLGAILDATGELAERAGDLNEALEFYEAALKQYQQYVAMDKLEPEHATFVAGRIEQLTEKLVEWYTAHANMLYEEGEYVAAARDMSRVIELDPENPRGYNNRAWYLAHGDTALDQALEDVNYALELLPAAYILDTRGFVYYKLGDYENALVDYYRAINKGSAYSFYGRGMVFQAIGARDEAIEDFTRFLQYFPGNRPDSNDARDRIEELRQGTTTQA